MSYTALYRALRPQMFKDVVEQAHIVKTLVNQINTKRVSHAYLFCGTRGTGKTSIAKIFAKAVNCYAPENGEPCGVCESCMAIDAGRSLNVIEIDAASNNGVENIRDIREEVKYPPAEGLYKVYIIDEVHMLSIGAFNALLKTLEEPPDHVIFILATTDPQKIPATILSRCQRFDFKRITAKGIADRISAYAQEEGLNIQADALRYIAAVSDGAMRDALSILDQCIAFYYDEEITLKKVLDIMGSVDKSVFFKLTEALHAYDSRSCMELIDSAVADGRDISQFVTELVLHFRNALVALSVGDDSMALSTSLENLSELKELAGRVGESGLMNYIGIFSQLQSQLRYAANERVLLEVACIKTCNPQESGSGDSLIPRIEKLETMIKNGPPQAEAHTVPATAEAPKKPTPKRKKATPEDIKKAIAEWSKICGCFGMPLRTYLQKSPPKYLEGDGLIIVTKDTASPEILKRARQEIKEGLSSTIGRDMEISIMSRDEYDARHTKIYGAPDDGSIEEESFTEVFGDDIIIE